MTEHVIVTIEPDGWPANLLARTLIDLADNPHDVVYVSQPPAGFKVPVEVYEKLRDGDNRPEVLGAKFLNDGTNSTEGPVEIKVDKDGTPEVSTPRSRRKAKAAEEEK